jgi:hypothetical protein
MIVLDVDPSVVKPGWTPLVITILLAAAIALLMISMRRHMRKVSLPYRNEVENPSGEPGTDRPADESSHDDGPGTPGVGSPGTPGDERRAIGHSG